MEPKWKFPSPPPAAEVVQESHNSSTNTIPLPSSHIPKTQSENQLSEDMAAAEWRDLCMFYRVVHGIRERQTANRMQRFDQPGTVMAICPEEECFAPTRSDFMSARGDTVTPNPPSNEASPHSPVHVGAYLASDAPSVPNDAMVNDDEWSITGYDGPQNPPPIPVVERDEDEDGGDDGIFSMDL